ncbi:4827_t:CDS:1, partial [Scutellospora calospora]
ILEEEGRSTQSNEVVVMLADCPQPYPSQRTRSRLKKAEAQAEERPKPTQLIIALTPILENKNSLLIEVDLVVSPPKPR